MDKRPNIVFMIADDHRYSDVHALFNPVVKTPNLDRLAVEGTSFLNTHIMGGQYRAVCSPCRACVHTGGHVFRAVSNESEAQFDDPMNNHMRINPDMELMPEVFRQSGYHTHAIGKWHNDKESFIKGFKSGENLFFGGMFQPELTPLHYFNPEGNYSPGDAIPSGKHATEAFCDAGVNFIENYNNEAPFFLYTAFTSPHDPRTAPKEFANLYDPADISIPKNFKPVHPFDNGEMHVRDEGLACLPRDPQEVSRHIADYYAMISHMDAEIGRVLVALEKKGVADNTIVVYTSDHGLAVGQHGLMGKQNLYDHSIRIPLLLRGPGIPRDFKSMGLTSQMDIFPTLCELTGISIPQTVDGNSLLALVKGEKNSCYDSLFAIYKDVQRMVKDDTYKLIRYYRSKERETGVNKMQLFNYKEDPWETNDLAGHPDYADSLRNLNQKMREWQNYVKDPLFELN